jgi:hypothetical protein
MNGLDRAALIGVAMVFVAPAVPGDGTLVIGSPYSAGAAGAAQALIATEDGGDQNGDGVFNGADLRMVRGCSGRLAERVAGPVWGERRVMRCIDMHLPGFGVRQGREMDCPGG